MAELTREEALKLLRGGQAGIAVWDEHCKTGAPDYDLRGVDLSGADLSGVKLWVTNLSHANLSGADLGGADFNASNLRGADLRCTDLRDASLVGVHLQNTRLADAKLFGAYFAATTVVDCIDLHNTIGLDSVIFRGPCYLDTHTLAAAQGCLPDSFLRGCGLQEWEILEAKLHDPALTALQVAELQNEIFTRRTAGPLFIGGVFISYAHDDSSFVDKLYKQLTDEGVRVWLDRHDLDAGDLNRQVTDAIRMNDIVLLVLSKSSVKSDWVDFELKSALRKEKEEDRDVLCPVALDDSWHAKTAEVLWHKVKEKNILDFAKWETTAFTPVFTKLVNGLKKYYPPKS